METTEKEMFGYQLNQAEWNIYVSILPNEALPTKRLYADAPMIFSILRPDAAELIMLGIAQFAGKMEKPVDASTINLVRYL